MANFSEIAHKKVAGVPVLYLAGAGVLVLGIVAWKLKPTTDGATDTTATDDTDTGTALDSSGNAYDTLNPDGNGTVTVVQQPSTDTTPDTVVKTNDDWVKDGSVWVAANVPGATVTSAYSALNKYITGANRSFDEQTYVDAWAKQNGPPPDGVAEGGTVANKPSKPQITKLPGYHTVTGPADNSYGLLAALYYGHNTQPDYDLIQAANVDKLGNGGPFAVGTKIYVPVYHPPVFYTTTAAMTSKTVASKNGISVNQLWALNNTTKATWPKGAKVRVK